MDPQLNYSGLFSFVRPICPGVDDVKIGDIVRVRLISYCNKVILYCKSNIGPTLI